MNHPILPAGWNSWELNGDEFNSAGVNEAIWPVFMNDGVLLKPIVVTADMLEWFQTECPDYVVACVADTVCIPAEIETLVIERAA